MTIVHLSSCMSSCAQCPQCFLSFREQRDHGAANLMVNAVTTNGLRTVLENLLKKIDSVFKKAKHESEGLRDTIPRMSSVRGCG